MPSSTHSVASLRQLLARRFGESPKATGAVLATGLPGIDEALGGLPCGAVSELVCAAPSCGGQLVLGHLLQVTRERGVRVALIDGADGFDPQSWPACWLEHLVWARCTSVATALQVADVLVRDANLGLVMIDLRRAREAELRRVPSTLWYRLQRAVEPSGLAVLVETPSVSVPSAGVRWQLERSHTLEKQAAARVWLAQDLEVVLQRQRTAALRVAS